MKNNTIAVICAIIAFTLVVGWGVWLFINPINAILVALIGGFAIIIGGGVLYGVYDAVSEILNSCRDNPPKKEKKNKWSKE